MRTNQRKLQFTRCQVMLSLQTLLAILKSRSTLLFPLVVELGRLHLHQQVTESPIAIQPSRQPGISTDRADSLDMDSNNLPEMPSTLF
jgi:hypothetical protein